MPASDKPSILHEDVRIQHRKDAFIDQLLTSKTLGIACKEIDIRPSTVQRWRREDPDFDDAVQDALDIASSEAEQILWDIFTDPDARPSDKIQSAKLILQHNSSSYKGRSKGEKEYIIVGNGSPMPSRAKPARLSSSEAGNVERPHDGS